MKLASDGRSGTCLSAWPAVCTPFGLSRVFSITEGVLVKPQVSAGVSCSGSVWDACRTHILREHVPFTAPLPAAGEH